jgi:8-oxo-dGTP diphosphatase
MSEYLTTGQVARELGLSVHAIQQWAKDRTVTPAFTTPGGRMRWTVDGLLRQLSGEQAQRPEPRPAQASVPVPVALAVITSRDGVVIGKRAEPPPPWSFIGAEIEDGESASDTAARAAREDARLYVHTRAIIGTRQHPATSRLLTYVACVPATRDHAISVGDDQRYTELKWASLREAADLMRDMDPNVLAHLQRVMRNR